MRNKLTDKETCADKLKAIIIKVKVKKTEKLKMKLSTDVRINNERRHGFADYVKVTTQSISSTTQLYRTQLQLS